MDEKAALDEMARPHSSSHMALYVVGGVVILVLLIALLSMRTNVRRDRDAGDDAADIWDHIKRFILFYNRRW